MKAKLKNLKENQIKHTEDQKKQKRSDNSSSNSDYFYLQIINLHYSNIDLTPK